MSQSLTIQIGGCESIVVVPVETLSVFNTLRVSTPRVSETLSTFSTHGSSIANTMSQTLMFQIEDVSIVSLCVAVPDNPNRGV